MLETSSQESKAVVDISKVIADYNKNKMVDQDLELLGLDHPTYIETQKSKWCC